MKNNNRHCQLFYDEEEEGKCLVLRIYEVKIIITAAVSAMTARGNVIPRFA